jgi:hypothetical protein
LAGRILKMNKNTKINDLYFISGPMAIRLNALGIHNVGQLLRNLNIDDLQRNLKMSNEEVGRFKDNMKKLVVENFADELARRPEKVESPKPAAAPENPELSSKKPDTGGAESDIIIGSRKVKKEI